MAQGEGTARVWESMARLSGKLGQPSPLAGLWVSILFDRHNCSISHVITGFEVGKRTSRRRHARTSPGTTTQSVHIEWNEGDTRPGGILRLRMRLYRTLEMSLYRTSPCIYDYLLYNTISAG